MPDDGEGGEALAAQAVFDQRVLRFQARHEATAAAEIDTVLAGRPPGSDAVQALPWLTATPKEVMRLFPPVAAAMVRRLTRDTHLGGVHRPARTLVRVTPWFLHRDPRWWPRGPEAFRPKRFLPASDTWTPEPIPRGADIPFGLGPRVCLGQHFAQVEKNLIAAPLPQRFRLAPIDHTAPRPQMAVTLRPAGGLRLRLESRA